MKKAIFFISLAVVISSCSASSSNKSATGTFEASETIISSEVNGRIVSFDIKEGDILESGMEIGLIDTVQMTLQRDILVASIAVLENGIPDVEIQLAPYYEELKTMKRERERIENLLKGNTATEKQLDDIESSIVVLDKKIASQREQLLMNINIAKAQIDVKRAELKQMEDMISRCRIITPIKGTVIAKYAMAGELTSAGKPLLRVANLDEIFLRAYITTENLESIRIGDKVKVKADFGNDRYLEYEGVVSWISQKSEFTPKNILTSDERANLVYAVKVSIQNDGYIKSGMYGELCFQ